MARGFYERPAPETRFWDNVRKGRKDDCWEWEGSRSSTGYGQICCNGNRNSTHRLSWEIHNGPIPDGMWVLHKCDNRKCVNPNHLFLGDSNTNNKDCKKKNRNAKGEGHGRSKLKEKDVLQIRNLYATGEHSQRSLARRFSVSQRTILRVIHKDNWADVGPTPLAATKAAKQKLEREEG